MPFRILGINHKTAPVEIREQIAFDTTTLGDTLRDLTQESGVREAVILSTCNRTELYWSGGATAEQLSAWLVHRRSLQYDVTPSLYQLEEREAIRHAFRVASGLDSMMLGEAQILGQIKDAYRVAQSAGSTGPALNRLFQASFSAAKRVRTETRIGANAVSIASAALALARRVFADLSARSALLIGAGEMIALTARHMSAQGIKRIVIANRNLARAQELAMDIRGIGVELSEIGPHLAEADIVVSSTASPTHIITKADAAAAIKARRRKPIFMVDLAVPRDIDPEVADLEDVYLFCIDDLQHVIAENKEHRASEATAALTLIDEEVARFESEARAHDAGPAIRALRTQSEAARAQTMEQARRLLASGRSADEVMEFLAHTLTNRLLHTPIQALREAAEFSDADTAQRFMRLLVRNDGS